MYTALLVIHSLLRWLVLLTGIYAAGSAISAYAAKRDWSPSDARAGLFFTIAIDTQALVGILLYAFFSPITKLAFHDMAGAMKVHAIRFYAVEHITLGILALAIVHITRVRGRKVNGVSRHKVAAIGFGLALVLIIALIPWPGLEYGRALFRLS